MIKIVVLISVLFLFLGKLYSQNNAYEGNANTITNFSSSGSPSAYGLIKSYIVNAGMFYDTTSANAVNYIKNYSGSQITTYGGGVTMNWVRYNGRWNLYSDILSESKTLGVIFSKTNFANTSDFTTNGITASAASNYITISGGANDFAQTLDYPYNSDLSKWEVSVKGVLLTTGNGFWIGKRPNTITGQDGCFLQLRTSDGKLVLSNQFGAIATSASALALTVNDTIEVRVSVSNYFLTATAFNITQQKIIRLDFEYTGDAQFITPGNMGTYSIGQMGGSFKFNGFYIKSSETKNADLLIIGDSKSLGFRVNYFKQYGTMLNNYMDVVMNCGGSELTADWIRRVPEIISLSPKSVLLTNPSNDLRYGVIVATTKSNYDSLEKVFRAAGINVYHSDGFYETVADPSAWSSWIESTRSADSIIYTYTATKYSGFTYAPADAHPSEQGHYTIFNTILNSGKIKPVSLKNEYDSTFFWSTKGNYLSTTNVYANPKFIGTIDSNDFVIKTFNAEKLRIKTNGNFHLPLITSSIFLGYNAGAAFRRFDTKNNIGIGSNALAADTGSSNNIAIGNNALLRLNSANSYNVAIGESALEYLNTVDDNLNTAIGSYAGYSITNGSKNVFLGRNSAAFFTSGEKNIFIGNESAGGLLSGNGNTIIGASMTGLSSWLSNTVIIGDGSGNKRIYVDSVGKIGIGTTVPSQKLHVDGNLKVVGQVITTPRSLTDGATITWDMDSSSNVYVTLGGNRTLSITNAVAGSYGTIVLTQDGTGSRTLALPASSKVVGGGAGVIALTTTAAAKDILTFYFDGTNYFWNYGKNYN